MTRLRPLRLTQIAVGSSFFALTPIVLDRLGNHLATRHTRTAVLGFELVLFFGGILADLLAEAKLRNGTWTDEQLAESWAWIGRPLWIRLNLAMVAAYLVCFFWLLLSHRHFGELGMTIFPSLTLSRLIASQRPKPKREWREPPPSAPLFSSHWGARG